MSKGHVLYGRSHNKEREIEKDVPSGTKDRGSYGNRSMVPSGVRDRRFLRGQKIENVPLETRL